MKRDKCTVSGKAQSRIKAAAEQIRIVRRDRGSAAHGDSLLNSALRSMSGGNIREAAIALEKFKQCPDLSNEHATLTSIACRHLRSKWVLIWTALKNIMKVTSLATGIWKALLVLTGNPINSAVLIMEEGFKWTYQEKLQKASHSA
jgi:hypothetical protein